MSNSKRPVVSFVNVLLLVSIGQILAHPEESLCCEPGPACRTGCRELRKAPLSHHFLNGKGITVITACFGDLWSDSSYVVFVEAKASFRLVHIYIYIYVYIYIYLYISIYIYI